MSEKLVAYFSAGGVTARAAKNLAEAAGADLYEIRPQIPYTAADLDAPVAECGVIFLGFPIWWYTAPTIINTFLESYDFSGKTIVLFATSGGSGLGRTAEDLRPSAKGAVLRDGKLLNGRETAETLRSWIDGMEL